MNVCRASPVLHHVQHLTAKVLHMVQCQILHSPRRTASCTAQSKEVVFNGFQEQKK